MTLLEVLVFPVMLPSMFPHRIQAHNLLHKQPPLQSRTCVRPSLPSKDYKIHLSCHLQENTTTVLCSIRGYNQFARPIARRTTSIANLSPTQSPNIKILFKRGVSLPPGLELGCLRWGIGASSIFYKDLCVSKQLIKRYKFILRAIWW